MAEILRTAQPHYVEGWLVAQVSIYDMRLMDKRGFTFNLPLSEMIENMRKALGIDSKYLGSIELITLDAIEKEHIPRTIVFKPPASTL